MARTTWIIAIVIVLVGAVVGVAIAREMGHRQRDKGLAIERLADELELTEEQRETIRDIRFEHREAEIESKAKLERAKLDMERAMSEDDFDRKKIYTLAEKVTQLEREMKLAGIDNLLRIMEVLTDEQRDRLQELRVERAERRMENRMERPWRGGFQNTPEE